MEWSDEAIVLGARKHGETSAIASVFARAHGLSSGLVRGARGKALRGVLETGNAVSIRWRARLPDHLGNFSCEIFRSFAAEVMDDRHALAAIASIAALLRWTLAEREAHPGLYETTIALLGALGRDDWVRRYVEWEVVLLAELGFGLDLRTCAATGTRENLVFVSPRTGRAVSAEAGAPYHDKLLRLPKFLMDRSAVVDATEIRAGLGLTGYFLASHVFAPEGRRLPAGRLRLAELLG